GADYIDIGTRARYLLDGRLLDSAGNRNPDRQVQPSNGLQVGKWRLAGSLGIETGVHADDMSAQSRGLSSASDLIGHIDEIDLNFGIVGIGRLDHASDSREPRYT